MNYDVTIQTIAWFNAQRNNNSLQISPKFQRRAVWLERERSQLIETIMLKLPFPEIYIQVVTDAATGNQQNVVVDGQQRITSIFRFIDGDSTLPDSEEWGLLSFRDLNEAQKREMWQYKIVVRMLYTESEVEIRDLFRRLNTNNIALNDQELRNARYVGKFKDACERLADNPFFQSINLFTAREIRRMQDVEFVSELLLRAVEGITNKKDMLDVVYAQYEEEFPQESKYEEEFNGSIQLINSITTEENASLFKSKSSFLTLFGACLDYFRTKRRSYFTNTAAVSAKLTTLLQGTKSYDPENPNLDPVIREYYDAVSRAASDKARRVRREDIMKDLIRQAELAPELNLTTAA